MNDKKTCKDCGETKPLDAFRRLPSGNRRGTCIACQRAYLKAYDRAKREAYEASPEYQALMVQRQKEKEEREAKRQIEAAAAAEAKAERERQEEARLEREERLGALRDDIWAAMKRGRSTRALQAVKDRPQGLHRMRVKDTPGFISIAELACRHAEREACRRAAKVCKTFEAAADAVRILEQATPTLERTRQMKQAWRTLPPPRPIEALQDPEEDCEDTDGFDEAFGDWAPAWMLAA